MGRECSQLLLVLVSCVSWSALAQTQNRLFEDDIEVDWGLVAGEYSIELANELLEKGVVGPPPEEDGGEDDRRALGIHTSNSLLWNDRRADGKVYIPLVYNSAYSASEVNTIRSAANALATAVGVIQFVDRTSEAAYIEFVDGAGCSSRIGRSGSRQTVTLKRGNPGCVFTGIVQHELMHAMGFWHEQSRSDRDAFVTILWDNIIPDNAHNFNIRTTRSLGSAYDYGSVMHYGAKAFTRNGLNTIDAPQPIGQRTGPSASDIQQLQLLYGTGASPTPAPVAPVPTNRPSASPTRKPTTRAPTTASPTTRAPTTASPTTRAPTTASPTTARPSTAPSFHPTTSSPSDSPTTSSPSLSPSASPTMPVCAAADWALWRAEDPRSPIADNATRVCAASCTTASDSGSCVALCMRNTYSETCATCFGDMVRCVEAAADCGCTAADLSAADCAACEALESCNAAFETCTGGFETRMASSKDDDGNAQASSLNVGLAAGIGGGFVVLVLALSGALVALRRKAEARRMRARAQSALGNGRGGPVAVANPAFSPTEYNRKFFNVDV